MIQSSRVLELLSRHGDLHSQLPTAWTGDFELPTAIETFYREVGPADVTIDGYGNPYFIPALESLWEFQAGYRWSGRTGERFEEWDDDWLVVADEGGDPFIFSRASGKILLAEHGTGEWDPIEIFPDINSMAASLAILGSIVKEAGDTFTDDDCNILPLQRSFAEKSLTEVLGSCAAAVDVLEYLGWG